MVEAGKLRHRITILSPETEQDSTTGEYEEVYTELATVWASWEPYSVKDMLSASNIQNETSVRCMIRYRSDVTARMRVLFRSKYYEIVGNPLPDTKSGIEYMTLMLSEVLSEQFST